MAFPTSLTNAVDDSVPGALDGTQLNAGHLNNLEEKVGVNDSEVNTSLDYLLKNAASVDPGHVHTDYMIDGGIASSVYGGVPIIDGGGSS